MGHSILRWRASGRTFCSIAGPVVPFNLNPRATLNYKNALYAQHIALLERYKSEVLAAEREGQRQKAQGKSSENTASELAEHNRVRQELTRMQAPENAIALQAAVKQYQEQFKHSVEVDVRNARELRDAGLHTTSFELVEHVSKVEDWEDIEQVQSIHYPEIRALVKDLTKSSHCFVNGHVIRRSGDSGCSSQGAFPPFHEVHSDFTENYKAALMRSVRQGVEKTPTFGVLEQLLAAGISAEELQQSRVIVVHAWRNVGREPLRDQPLAVCDSRSVGQEELIREKVRGLERYRAMHRASHRWHWFPDMTRDEVLLFKGFDSECSRFAFHSAFHHADKPKDAPDRFSCEMRVMCLIAG